jgi:hypothetical protein
MKFDTLDVHGNPIEIKTPTLDALKTCVVDKSAQSERRGLAASILAWSAQREQASAGLPASDRAAALMQLELDAEMLWKGNAVLVTEVGADGVRRTTVVPVSTQTISVPTPVPAPKPTTSSERPSTPFVGQRDSVVASQTFEPAIPLPVLPVSDVEAPAVAGLSDQFLNGRYSP